jgi:hypothetical protein
MTKTAPAEPEQRRRARHVALPADSWQRHQRHEQPAERDGEARHDQRDGNCDRQRLADRRPVEDDQRHQRRDTEHQRRHETVDEVGGGVMRDGDGFAIRLADPRLRHDHPEQHFGHRAGEKQHEKLERDERPAFRADLALDDLRCAFDLGRQGHGGIGDQVEMRPRMASRLDRTDIWSADMSPAALGAACICVAIHCLT